MDKEIVKCKSIKIWQSNNVMYDKVWHDVVMNADDIILIHIKKCFMMIMNLEDMLSCNQFKHNLYKGALLYTRLLLTQSVNQIVSMTNTLKALVSCSD